MNSTQLAAKFIATGRFHDVGIGSSLSDLQQRIRSDFFDVIDEDGDSMRRDYGFIEFYLNSGNDWTVSGGAIELHKLANHADMGERWRISMHDAFPQFTTWNELHTEFSRIPNRPILQKIDQGDFMEYRSSATKVSVLVSNDHEERDGWLGHGDVWSISLG